MERMSCTERCLNGGADFCDGSNEYTCKCNENFKGQYCEKPSSCHPGNVQQTLFSILSAFCDRETSTCVHGQCVKVQNSSKALTTVLFTVINLINTLV